jgi:hypothetical protein
MSRYQVDKLLRDLRRDEDLAGRFRNDIEPARDSYQLDGVERELLRRWEIRELYERCANPLLLLLVGVVIVMMLEPTRMMLLSPATIV